VPSYQANEREEQDGRVLFENTDNGIILENAGAPRFPIMSREGSERAVRGVHNRTYAGDRGPSLTFRAT
jgi:hypothetical protein